MNYPAFAGHGIHLETERLVLRPFEREDFGAALPYYQDPDLLFAMEGTLDRPMNLDSLERIGECMARQGYLFAVVERASQRAIGELCLEWMNLSRAEVQPGERVMRTPLGIWDKALWGKGYGREMLNAVIAYAFEEMGIDRLCAMDVALSNKASQRLFRSCGYRKVRVTESEGTMDLEITREAYVAGEAAISGNC